MNLSRFKTALAVAVAPLALASAAVVTSAPASAFDPAATITQIGTYQVGAVLLVGTMIAGFWAVRALGLFGRK